MIQEPETDSERYLVEPRDWTEEIARTFARQEDITLTDEHWVTINFMREYQADHQIAPDARFVIKHLSKTIGAGRNRLFELFLYGYVQQACKIADMKRPRAWSAG